MLQKELAKRLRARYDTKMDGNGWLEVSSDGIPLCRIKYNGQYLSNADKTLSDEYRSKIADIQDEISTVREYVGLYEHAPQMQAADVSDYRQLAAFGDTVLAATYSEKNGLKSIALNHAGVSESKAYDMEIELDDEDGTLVYKVEFKFGGMEYSYEINAATGAILKHEAELDD